MYSCCRHPLRPLWLGEGCGRGGWRMIVTAMATEPRWAILSSEWDQPPVEMRPLDSITIKDYAIETPLTKSSTSTEADSVYEVKIDFNTKSSIAAINFVLKAKPQNWMVSTKYVLRSEVDQERLLDWADKLYPTGITSTYFKSRSLVDIVRYTCRHLAALRIYYAKEMDLFAFICHSDPTKVRVGERNLAEKEVKFLKMTEGRTVLLGPPVTAASGDSSDSIDRLFDEGHDAGQEHSVEKGDDVLEEAISKDALEVISLPPNTSGKSLAALHAIIPEGSDLLSGVTEPLIAIFVAPMRDVGPVDSVFGLNLWNRPPYVRYVVSSDGSHHSGSYFEATSFVGSLVADAPVVTVVVTTTVDADVAAGSKARDVSKDFENIRDSTSAGGSLDTETMYRAYIPRWKVTNDSVLDDPYVCRDLTDRLAPPALFAQLRAMDYDQLYSEFNIGASRQVCREKDAKIAHLKSLLSLKETEAAESISLRSQLSVMETADAAKSTELRDLKEKNFAFEGERNALSGRVTTFESVTISKEAELVSLSSQVIKLTADLSGFQLSHDELNSNVASLESERDCLVAQKSSLESAFELFKERIEALQDEQA
ncbi:hypothetical protein Tco_1020271 [Tanacetum coccineum]|uniref:Alpha-glucan water dikinase-like N-terminal Ig-like domain-containing protein n=1 Tax=Tanacetum coccineum TaxID=301880 RepID=A0ABQ5FZJ2_9ASTR